MDYIKGFKMVQKAAEMHQEERLFQRWIAGHQKEISFDEFRDKLYALVNKPPDKSEEEIFKAVADIIDTFNKGVS